MIATVVPAVMSFRLAKSPINFIGTRQALLTASVLQGYVSNADYSGKKTVLVLFINGRPVDCSTLKRALEATYAAILPKAAKPWVFLVGFLLICLAQYTLSKIWLQHLCTL